MVYSAAGQGRRAHSLPSVSLFASDIESDIFMVVGICDRWRSMIIFRVTLAYEAKSFL